MIARQLLVSGRVQGVGFREGLVAVALGEALVGWVRNRHDGTVEAWLQGAPEAVARAIEWCRRGPPLARVTRVQEIPVDADGGLRTFSRRPSA